MNTLQQEEADRFLFTGEYDNRFDIWPGNTFVDRVKSGEAALRGVLVSAVRHAGELVAPPCLESMDLSAFAQAKFLPMVSGLFPPQERLPILNMLERAVVFLTPEATVTVLKNTTWLSTAWKLANIYLESCASKMLSDEAPTIVGLSEETTCYVSMEYFRSDNQFDDYVVHEAAHIFHNCKRETVGLPADRRREWLLDIDFAKRETFAYACEAFSRILDIGGSRAERNRLLSELAKGPMPPDRRVDGAEYVDILREAVAARNGWKRIRERCSPAKPARHD